MLRGTRTRTKNGKSRLIAAAIALVFVLTTIMAGYVSAEETDPLTQNPPEQQMETLLQPEQQTEAETGTQPEQQTEAETGTQPEQQTEVETGTQPEQQTETEMESQSQIVTEQQEVPDSNGELEPQSDVAIETESNESFAEYNSDYVPGDFIKTEAPLMQTVRPETYMKTTSNPASFGMLRSPISLPVSSESTFVSPTVPGQITIGKYAIPVEGLVNTWDVTLRIEGMDTTKSSDIVLVIDRSGSMYNENRMGAAKAAAIEFVNALLADASSTARIAIVSFASDYPSYSSGGHTFPASEALTVHAGLTGYSGKQTLLNILAGGHDSGSIRASGGTLTQAGIKQAALMLLTENGSTADYKNMVLLSDGEPTLSYGINNLSRANDFVGYNQTYLRNQNYNSSATQTGNIPFVTKNNLPSSRYNYGTIVGYGTAAFTRAFSSYPDYYYSHGNSTIAEAGYFKNTVEAGHPRTMWTVALSAGTYGNSVLNACASPGKAYVATTEQLAEIFANIAGSINSAVKDAGVADPMGIGFTVPDGVSGITVSQGTAAYDSITNEIDWEAGTLYNPISPGSKIKYATMTYRVSINDLILGVEPDSDGLYPTNGDTSLSYTDANGDPQNLLFPVPKVNPIFLIIQKQIQDSAGNIISDPTRSFNVRVSSDATDGDTIASEYNRTFAITDNQPVITTDLRLADQYFIEEIADDYDIKVFVNTVETSTFVVDAPIDWPDDVPDAGLQDCEQEDLNILVVNKEKPKCILTIMKVDSETHLALPGSTFELYAGDINGPTGEALDVAVTDENGKVTFGPLINGTYWIVEVEPPDGYYSIKISPIGPFVVGSNLITGPEGYTPVRESDTSNFIVTVNNEPMRELPAAGGTGTLPYAVGGLALMILASYRILARRRAEAGE